MFHGYYDSPVGIIEIQGTNEAITLVDFVDEKKESNENAIIKETIQQLDEYFKGQRQVFDVKVTFEGTPFQEKVWQELMNIPYGEQWSYKKVAERIGNPKAVRAVGSTNGKNKISILIPCHRVVGANGKLVGYAGGLTRKEWLLNHEGRRR